MMSAAYSTLSADQYAKMSSATYSSLETEIHSLVQSFKVAVDENRNSVFSALIQKMTPCIEAGVKTNLRRFPSISQDESYSFALESVWKSAIKWEPKGYKFSTYQSQSHLNLLRQEIERRNARKYAICSNENDISNLLEASYIDTNISQYESHEDHQKQIADLLPRLSDEQQEHVQNVLSGELLDTRTRDNIRKRLHTKDERSVRADRNIKVCKGRYRVILTHNERQFPVGVFDSLSEAQEARDEAEKNISEAFQKFQAEKNRDDIGISERGGRFRASIRRDGKIIWLGTFDSKEEAIAVRKKSLEEVEVG